MKILVTGASGFIGSYLSRHCVEQGNEVHLCDNNKRGKVDSFIDDILSLGGSRFIEADLTNKNDLSKLDDDYDVIFHLAAINGTENFYNIPYTVMEVAIKSTMLLLEKYKDTKTKFVFTSSSEVYAGSIQRDHSLVPTTEDIHCTIDDVMNERYSYGGSKLACEILLNSFSKQFGLNYQIIRYHNIYGPRMGTKHVMPQFILRAKSKESPFNLYGDTQTRAFCFIDDAIRATYNLSLIDDNGIFHIGNDEEEIKISDLAKKVNLWYNNDENYAIKEAPKGSVNRRCPDITKLKELISYTPKVNLNDGLAKTIEWYDKWFEDNGTEGIL